MRNLTGGLTSRSSTTVNRLEMTGACGRNAGTAWSLKVDHAPSGKVALERARCFFLDLGPRRIGNRGKLAAEISDDEFESCFHLDAAKCFDSNRWDKKPSSVR
jgi:hypothetical protein